MRGPATSVGPSVRYSDRSEMRLLVAADLHYTLRQLDWVERVAGDYDLVILGGDELDVASSVPLDAQIKVLLRYVEAIARKTVVLVNSGNHDLNARDADGEKVAAWLPDAKRDGVYVDGDTLSMGDVLFTVCPWWDGPLAQRRVEGQLAADRDQRPGTWTWVYHSPPKGPLSWTGQRHFGDDVLEGWIERFAPDLVFTGHVHQAPFTEEGSWAQRLGATWVFNAGRQTSETPAHVVVDLDAHEEFWWSPFGAGTLRLDDPAAAPAPAAPD